MVKAQQVMERLEDKHQKARAEKRTAWDLNAWIGWWMIIYIYIWISNMDWTIIEYYGFSRVAMD